MDRDYYLSYETWKNWQENSEFDDSSGAQFEKELMRASISPGSKILELGFGAGTFISWASSNGYEVVGIEINKEMVEKVSAKGQKVFFGKLEDVIEQIGTGYDAVVAFDVFEHLDKEEILINMMLINSILSNDGRLILRFPNGQSPFGRCYQYGDLTHKTILSGSSIEQAGLMTGFSLVGCYNPIRKQTGKKPRIVRKMAYLVRDLLEIVIGHVYYKMRLPLDPNLICILRKDSQSLR